MLLCLKRQYRFPRFCCDLKPIITWQLLCGSLSKALRVFILNLIIISASLWQLCRSVPTLTQWRNIIGFLCLDWSVQSLNVSPGIFFRLKSLVKVLDGQTYQSCSANTQSSLCIGKLTKFALKNQSKKEIAMEAFLNLEGAFNNTLSYCL